MNIKKQNIESMRIIKNYGYKHKLMKYQFIENRSNGLFFLIISS